MAGAFEVPFSEAGSTLEEFTLDGGPPMQSDSSHEVDPQILAAFQLLADSATTGKRPGPPFAQRAFELLAEHKLTRGKVSGKISHCLERAINAAYRKSLLSRLDVRQTPVLLSELSRNSGNVTRGKGREFRMDLFFPIAVGRNLEPREFIPEISVITAVGALETVGACGRMLDAEKYSDAICDAWHLRTAMFLLEHDRVDDLFRSYDTKDRLGMEGVIAEILTADGETLRKFARHSVTDNDCLFVVAKWMIPVSAWYWTLPLAFEEGFDDWFARNA